MATEAQKRARTRYETNTVKRINCRFPLDLFQRMEKTGESSNALIINAVTEYLDRKEKPIVYDLEKLLNG